VRNPKKEARIVYNDPFFWIVNEYISAPNNEEAENDFIHEIIFISPNGSGNHVDWLKTRNLKLEQQIALLEAEKYL
jgi:hypothetical protein